MTAVSENTVDIRRIQGYAVLLSCLPANGKAREFFNLALALDEGPVLDRIAPPEDPDSFEGMQAWFESFWGADGVTPEEQKLVDWQANPDNMAAAVSEFKTIMSKVDG
jgi:hypothetical protein